MERNVSCLKLDNFMFTYESVVLWRSNIQSLRLIFSMIC